MLQMLYTQMTNRFDCCKKTAKTHFPPIAICSIAFEKRELLSFYFILSNGQRWTPRTANRNDNKCFSGTKEFPILSENWTFFYDGLLCFMRKTRMLSFLFFRFSRWKRAHARFSRMLHSPTRTACMRNGSSWSNDRLRKTYYIHKRAHSQSNLVQLSSQFQLRWAR